MPKLRWISLWKMETPYDNEPLEEEERNRKKFNDLATCLGVNWNYPEYTLEDLEELKEERNELEEDI